VPFNATGDLQVAGEVATLAIQTTFARAGRRIAVIGHSQGGMVPRWALKLLAETPAMVSDLVGLRASNPRHRRYLRHLRRDLCIGDQAAADRAAVAAGFNAGGETMGGVAYRRSTRRPMGSWC
jgi:triacylglycerol esterase/lipase EstA (alpha/beta hydrolase family)